jgi:transketolase
VTRLSARVGRELMRLAGERDDVVIVETGTGALLHELRDLHPSRCIRLGGGDANAVSVAAGMAASGLRPYLITARPLDAGGWAEQLRADVARARLPVRVLALPEGLGFGAAGRQAAADITIARAIANLTLVAPADELSAVALLRCTADMPGPVLYRLGEDLEAQVYVDVPIIGRGRFLSVRPGRDATIIGTGIGVPLALGAAELLAAGGVAAAVLDAAYLKPLDEDAVVVAARTTGVILTVEEHSVVGGLGSAVAEVLAGRRLPVRLGVLGLPDEDLDSGPRRELLSRYGLTPSGVADRVRELLRVP